jgi:hypothetical protein
MNIRPVEILDAERMAALSIEMERCHGNTVIDPKPECVSRIVRRLAGHADAILLLADQEDGALPDLTVARANAGTARLRAGPGAAEAGKDYLRWQGEGFTALAGTGEQ